VYTLERIFWIVAVRRILAYASDSQAASGCRFFFAPHGRRIDRQQLLIPTEDLQLLDALVDFNPRHLARETDRLNVCNNNISSRDVELFTGIEHLKQILAHVKLLREFLTRAFV
jgi:hypothetical protein